jgi:hypothetical protein
MISEREEILKALRAGPLVLGRLVRDLDDATIRRRPAAGEWAIVEVIAHLADTEERAMARTRRMLAEDRPPLPGYSPDALAEERNYIDMQLPDELARFTALRSEQAAGRLGGGGMGAGGPTPGARPDHRPAACRPHRRRRRGPFRPDRAVDPALGVPRQELIDPHGHLVAHASEGRHALLVAAGGRGWIVEIPVQAALRPREDGAALASAIADGDHPVEGVAKVSVHGLALLGRDVDAQLGHDENGFRSYGRGLRACAEGLVGVATPRAEQPFRHLAARRVVGAQEQDALTVHVGTLSQAVDTIGR